MSLFNVEAALAAQMSLAPVVRPTGIFPGVPAGQTTTVRICDQHMRIHFALLPMETMAVCDVMHQLWPETQNRPVIKPSFVFEVLNY